MKENSIYLVVTIDTEEDNWGIHRSGVTTRNIDEVPKLQQLFNQYQVRPTYLVTYQIAKSPQAAEILRNIEQSGKSELGLHLHPWNTPPIVETADSKNSMLGNLPVDLQKDKLKTCIDQHLHTFGSLPKSFRAGRWGLRGGTVSALTEAGIEVDSSLTPFTYWEEEGLGRVFNYSDTEPCFIGFENQSEADRMILEVPVSIGYNRWPPHFWHEVSNHLKKAIYRPLRPVGVLHHTNILRKIWLSPEVCSANDMIRLAKLMIAKGKKLLNFTFHTPSLLAGCGPFVKDGKDLNNFYRKIEIFMKFAEQHPQIQFATLSQVRERCCNDPRKICGLMIQ